MFFARPQRGDLGLELGDARLQGRHQGEDFVIAVARRDVLRAVDVPGIEREQDGPLDISLVAGFGQPLEQFGIVLDNPRPAPDLDAAAVGIIHQEDIGLVVLGQVAGGDVLAVAAEIGEAEGLVVEGLEETRGPTAMLDIGLALGGGGGQVEGVALAEERGEVFGDAVAPAALLLHAGVAGAAAEPFLERLDGGREGDVADRAGHHALSSFVQ